MSLILRIPKTIRDQLLADLRRPHRHALERVAFCSVAIGNRGQDPTLVLVTDWWSIPDDQYLQDPRSGARINTHAIRGAMQHILDSGHGVLHVHLHDHSGQPEFGRMDRREIPRLVDSFRSTNGNLPQGMLVLSEDSATAFVSLPGDSTLSPADQITVVGWPTTLTRLQAAPVTGRFARQSFLGAYSEAIIATAKVAIIGLGGGGSHFAQQLAHLGFLNYVLYDEQRIEDTNLNRLVGATEQDVADKSLKVDIAARVIRGVRAKAVIEAVPQRWQDNALPLRSCDLVFGSVDGFDERRQLETTCRRYLIPYIDIGMDVHSRDKEPPRLVGQVIASIPGLPCMQCFGFLNEQTLAREAQRYGDAGDQPQVVWSNGVLASTAVGIGVDLLTNWSDQPPRPVYLSYDGNASTLTPHVRLGYLPHGECPHHRYVQAGDPAL